MDFLIMSDAALKEHAGLGRALCDAWFDAMEFITNSQTRTEGIDIMAKAAGSSVEEFNKMLADTDLFTDRKKTADFLVGSTMKDTMTKVKDFSFDKGLVENDKFTIGYGKEASDLLRFDPSYLQ
jgi:NitT/TauT family transport system substrate-binding protein